MTDSHPTGALDLEASLRKLVQMARTSGGTAGPDQALMEACAEAEDALIRYDGDDVGSLHYHALEVAKSRLQAVEGERDALKAKDADWNQESYDEGYREGNCDAQGAAGDFWNQFIRWATGERQLLDHQSDYTAEELFDALTSHEQEICNNADRFKARAEAAEAALAAAREALAEIQSLPGSPMKHPDAFDRGARAAHLEAAEIARAALQPPSPVSGER